MQSHFLRAALKILWLLLSLIPSVPSLAADAILNAVERGDVNQVRELLKNYEGINHKYDDSRTFSLPPDQRFSVDITNFSLLHIAAGWGDLPMAQLLLEHGADPSLREDKGLMPGEVAAFFLGHQSKSRDYLKCAYLLRTQFAPGG